MPEAFQQMLDARQTISHAGFVALIVYSDSIRMRFDLDDTATRTDIGNARTALLRVIEQSPIDEISLQPPYPTPVSYTHLDVYKRQSRESAGRR